MTSSVRAGARSDDVAALRGMLARVRRQMEAVGRASQIEGITSGDVEAAAREIVELAAQAIGCERVNAWLFNADESELHCIACYEASHGRHSAGAILREPDFRGEFQALKSSRYVDADEPLTDPRTKGYAEGYLRPLRITSMLDVVIRASGRHLGLLCFEHVDTPHHWEEDEISFGCQLADKLGLALMTRVRRQSEEQLRESAEALAEAQAIARVGSWEYDVQSEMLTCSSETYRILGVDPATFKPSYEALLARVHPDDRAAVEMDYADSVAKHTTHAFDHRLVMDDGTIKYVHERGHSFYDDAGRRTRAIGTVQDITDRKRSEAELQFANTLLTTQLETSPDGILVVNENGRVLLANRRFADMWRVPFDSLQGADDAVLLATAASQVKNPEIFLARVRHLYAHPDEDCHDELEMADGRWFDRHTAVLRTSAGQDLGRIWFFRDVTDRKRAEAQIRYTARHDQLTGLANRGVFVEAMSAAITRAKRARAGFAVLCLDLDHFKDVNDTLGHSVGDELLRAVAQRLQATTRATDTVARFGGDEFAVLATDVANPADVAVLAEAVIRDVGEPFWIQGNEIRTGTSIGISVHLDEWTDPEALLAHADVALYRAKAEGRGAYRFFTYAMDEEVRTRVRFGAELRSAVALGELFVLYQPQVDMETGSIVGVEALVRWRHPERGILSPALFIPMAEESGLILALGQHVLHESCEQARRWLEAGIAPKRLAVNLSALQFKSALDLEEEIVGTLTDTSFPAGRLELEITETALMVASREHGGVLERLRERGIGLAIDDFGTGYSSLDYLRRFPVDRIKLAQNFVGQIATVPGCAAIVKATIGLARELGIAVIAEGVDSKDQLSLLRAWGCREAQGFYFAEPLTADEITPLLRGGAVLRGTSDRLAEVA